MKKILLFSFFLMLGLVVSQFLPAMVGEGYSSVKTISNTLLYVCLAFIMINVGREFEMDKSRWRSYTEDYFIAMATAAFPWIFVALYYMFVLLPDIYWNSGEAWKENLLLSRFAAPTSAGILFTMLAAAGLKSSWVYKKVQVLAIFDDLDTILLMIPLQIMMVGLRWQLGVIILIVMGLLIIGWRKMGSYDMRQDWKAILFYAVLTCGITQAVYLVSKYFYGEDASIHIEVLLPAFVLGMVMRHKHIDTKVEHNVATAVSFLFMFLVGLFRSGLRRAVCRGDNDNRSTADDVLAGDHPACRDCFVPVQYRETVPTVFLPGKAEARTPGTVDRHVYTR